MMLTGVLGLVAVTYRSKQMMEIYMVFAILSGIYCVLLAGSHFYVMFVLGTCFLDIICKVMMLVVLAHLVLVLVTGGLLHFCHGCSGPACQYLLRSFNALIAYHYQWVNKQALGQPLPSLSPS